MLRISPMRVMSLPDDGTYSFALTMARWEVQLEALADARVASAVARHAASFAGLPPSSAAAVATAAAELATNAIKHAGGGRITMERRGGGIWLIVEDRGAGCATELAQMFARASTNPRSHGIGAVARLTDGVRLSQRHDGGLAIEVWKTNEIRPK